MQRDNRDRLIDGAQDQVEAEAARKEEEHKIAAQRCDGCKHATECSHVPLACQDCEDESNYERSEI